MVSRHLIENGGPWGTGWGCFGRGLAPPFRLGFRSMEDIKRTLPALAATPLRPVQLKGRGYTTCTSLMTLMWFRCHIPHLTPTQFNGTLNNIAPCNLRIIIIVRSHHDEHRRRKMLKVGWAQYIVARKIFMTTPFLCQTMPIFARSRLLS